VPQHFPPVSAPALFGACRAGALGLIALTAACGQGEGSGQQPSADPVISQALSEQLMVDPDLARINPAYAVMGGGGPATAPIPEIARSAETVAAARGDAADLAEGQLGHAPAPQPGGKPLGDLTAELTARAAIGPAHANCAALIGYDFGWAAKMPAAFPVYPRGHAQEAAGADGAGCRLRVVHFLSPVPIADIADFYWNQARAAGLAPDYRLAGQDHVIRAVRGGSILGVSLRDRDGLTEADLVTFGL
jgi:hypothetical protein